MACLYVHPFIQQFVLVLHYVCIHSIVLLTIFFSADILNVSELPEEKAVVESVVSYDWHIDTKYYAADVLLCTTNARTIGDESFADSVQAFVAYFDSQEVSFWLICFVSSLAGVCVLALSVQQ